MTTSFSKIIWDNISLLWYLQFPWRFLEFAAFFSAFLVGGLVFLVKKDLFKIILAVFLVALVIFYNQKYFVPQFQYPTITDSDLTSFEEISWHVSLSSFEFLPKGMPTHKGKLGNDEFSITKNQLPIERYQILSGSSNITKSNFNPGKFSFSGNFPTDTSIRFNIANFPGWQVLIDGVPARINEDNLYRLITISVPKGEHTIVGSFGDTPIRKIGNIVSLVSLLSLVFMSKFLWNTKK